MKPECWDEWRESLSMQGTKGKRISVKKFARSDRAEWDGAKDDLLATELEKMLSNMQRVAWQA
ncbi:hypothetical protein Ocin01_16770 [Orchesella cincta]|uniref:Uncharacterized protein n=1 Tax=Orchesella cincta TaxID=48709 RepID=A0A1D2MAL2_ORCCI|nr:hypothetical protein Ocin01_16770 [Orchesella cincta]